MMKILSTLLLAASLLVGGWDKAHAVSGPTTTLQNAVAATGSGTVLPVDQYNSVSARVTISNTATVVFKASHDGTTWDATTCVKSDSTSSALTTTVTNAAASGMYRCNVAGYRVFKAEVTAYTSGTITVTADASTAVFASASGGGGGGSLTIKELDGSPLVAGVTSIQVTNGSLTDNGSGDVTIATSGAANVTIDSSAVTGGTASSFLYVGAGPVLKQVSITGLVLGGGASAPSAYGGTTCTNQVVRLLSASGAATCVTITSAYVDSSIGVTGTGLGQFASTTSATLAGVLSDESGSGGGFVRATGATVALAGLNVPNSANLPVTCTVGDIYQDNDASTGGQLAICEATNTWAVVGTGGGGGSTGTLDQAFDNGKVIDGANSKANAVRIGDGTTPICLYTDATIGPQIRPCTDADTKTTIATNFTYSLFDEEKNDASNGLMETVDPDGSTAQDKWQYPSAYYRPLKSIYIPAGAMSTDGTNCPAPAEVTINSGAKRWTIICADNDSSTIYFEVEMPDSWDGGTVTVMGSFVQTAADTSNLNADITLACRKDGDTINNTWGTEVAMDTAMGGSNKIDTVTTAAITPNGTCTGAGTLLQGRYQVDATGTTTAMATLHHLGFKIEYSIKSRSD